MTGSFGRHRWGLGLSRLLLAAAIAGCADTGTAMRSAPTAGSAAGGSPGAAQSLLGTWTTSITRDDLASAGVTDPGLQTENSGRFRWTFASDGTWTQVQQSIDGAPLNGPVFRGTYVADETSLVMTTEFPEQYRDEGLHFTWATDGDELSVDVLDPPDPMLPVIIEAHPWRRVP
jgi:hypothetical protein